MVPAVVGSSPIAHPTYLALIIHELATAAAQASILTVFRSAGLVDVLRAYDCSALRREPCQYGVSTTSLR